MFVVESIFGFKSCKQTDGCMDLMMKTDDEDDEDADGCDQHTIRQFFII